MEQAWSDVHISLIVGIADALAPQLPDDLISRIARFVEASSNHQSRPGGATFLSRNGLQHRPHQIIEDLDPPPEKWLEIRNLQGTIITIIEVISPWNKQGTGLNAYREKQRRHLESRINLVEIDLLRGGQHAISAPPDLLKPHQGARYLIRCTRGTRPNRHEVYSCPLRDPLPIIPALSARPTPTFPWPSSL